MKICFMMLMVAFALTCVPNAAYSQNIQIFNGEDIDFGTWLPGDGRQTSNDFFCVFKDAGNRRWDVIATGSGPGSAFQVEDGVGNTIIPQFVRIRNGNMTATVQRQFGQADNTPPADCGGTDNQRFRVRFNNGPLSNAPPGVYTGTITLTVTPP